MLRLPIPFQLNRVNTYVFPRRPLYLYSKTISYNHTHFNEFNNDNQILKISNKIKVKYNKNKFNQCGNHTCNSDIDTNKEKQEFINTTATIIFSTIITLTFTILFFK